MPHPTPLCVAALLAGVVASSCTSFEFDEAIQKVGYLGGASIGATEIHDYEASEGDRVDGSDTGWAVWGGYQASPFWGGLLGYVDFGTLHAEGPGGGGFTDAIDYSGFAALAMGVLPVHERTAVVGLTGAFFWNQKVDYDDASGPFDADESGVSPALGSGLNYYLDDLQRYGVNVTWLHVFEAGDFDKTDHDSDLDFFSLGVTVHM